MSTASIPIFCKGLEPDECFYIQKELKIRGRDDLNFNIDPSPDLVLEVDITSRSIERLPIYAVLGVPEVWRYDGQKLNALHLVMGGAYEPAGMEETSLL